MRRFLTVNIRRIIGIRQGIFPFTYLGYPIFYGRKNKGHFEDLIKKVMKRLHSWQRRFLSYEGKYILIAHVLQSIPSYTLSAMNPPVSVINQLHRFLQSSFGVMLQVQRINTG